MYFFEFRKRPCVTHLCGPVVYGQDVSKVVVLLSAMPLSGNNLLTRQVVHTHVR